MKRKKWSQCERGELMKLFHAKEFPEREELRQLAKSLNTSLIRVVCWFGTMRHKKTAEGVLRKGE